MKLKSGLVIRIASGQGLLSKDVLNIGGPSTLRGFVILRFFFVLAKRTDYSTRAVEVQRGWP